MGSSTSVPGLIVDPQWEIKEELISNIEGGGTQFNRKYIIRPVNNKTLCLHSDGTVWTDFSCLAFGVH